VDVDTPALYLREIVSDKLAVEQQVERALHLTRKYTASVLGVELTGIEHWARKPFLDALMVNGLYTVQFMHLKARTGKGDFSSEEGGKIGRAMPLSAYYKWHLVWHNEECPEIAVLESRMDRFPQLHSNEWDALDAAAYILQVLSELGVTFESPTLLANPLDEIRRERPPEVAEYARKRGKSASDMTPEEIMKSSEWEDPLEDPFSDRLLVMDDMNLFDPVLGVGL
jgi:hypothetical protein